MEREEGTDGERRREGWRGCIRRGMHGRMEGRMDGGRDGWVVEGRE